MFWATSHLMYLCIINICYAWIVTIHCFNHQVQVGGGQSESITWHIVLKGYSNSQSQHLFSYVTTATGNPRISSPSSCGRQVQIRRSLFCCWEFPSDVKCNFLHLQILIRSRSKFFTIEITCGLLVQIIWLTQFAILVNYLIFIFYLMFQPQFTLKMFVNFA